MTFNAKDFCQDYNIDFRLVGKNIQDGWVGICCPYCNDHNYHGGFDLENGRYHCWRCGNHYLPKVITKLTGIYDSIPIIKNYSTGRVYVGKRTTRTAQECTLPAGCTALHGPYLKYLEQRGFSAGLLEKKWDMHAANHIGDYKFRIIAPIYLRGELISYQGRDITGKSDLRYKACKLENEVIHHQDTLYGIDYARSNTVIVEGITDVWRLGPGAIATFGIDFTRAQIEMMIMRFKKVAILFDGEAQAQKQARKLVEILCAYNIECRNLILPEGDPGDLNQIKADKLMKYLLEKD